jgi:lipoic acid synthetase
MKPVWLRRELPDAEALAKMRGLLRRHGLHTVCEGALCPNQGECFGQGTATFLILGNTCTRSCTFCAIPTEERPPAPDPGEPERIARASAELGLRHVVVTSVTRDDLQDGGAAHFAETVRALSRITPEITVEILIPDFQGSAEALRTVLESAPHILNHNLETVPRLYLTMRQGASYRNSLQVLANSKKLNPQVCTKSGIMLGVGEKRDEVVGVMHDLRSVDCDFLTLGQYLRPAADNLEVTEFIKPEAFEEYRVLGYEMGFRYVASSPFVRSSFHAEEALKAIGHGHTPTN